MVDKICNGAAISGYNVATNDIYEEFLKIYKNHQIVYIKYIQFSLYQLYLNKAV